MLTVACNDQIEPPQAATLPIAVDGWIENNNYAYVYLSEPFPYYGNLDSAFIRSLIISNALVFLSDSRDTEQLALFSKYNAFPPFYYRSIYMKGKPGSTYKLIVLWHNDTITATTTIPDPAAIQSIAFTTVDDQKNGYFVVTINDKQGQNNFYRLFFANKGFTGFRYTPALISNFSDQNLEGATISLPLKKGPDSYLNGFSGTTFPYNDTLEIKLCTESKPAICIGTVTSAKYYQLATLLLRALTKSSRT